MHDIAPSLCDLAPSAAPPAAQRAQASLFVASASGLNDGQRHVIQAARAWYRLARNKGARVRPYFYFTGLAGTGKTYLLPFLIDALGVNEVCYAAFSGKAASVMRKRGLAGATTIHSLIYRPVVYEDANGRKTVTFALNPRSELATADLLVLDEVSMVGVSIMLDALSFGVPVIVLGDEGQLPPIHGQGFFANVEPDARLTEIRRQALDNPIIRASLAVREDPSVDLSRFADGERLTVRTITAADIDSLAAVDQVLCGTNKVRVRLNRRLRRLAGFESNLPGPGAKLVITRNNKAQGLFNGVTYECQASSRPDPRLIVARWEDDLRTTRGAKRAEKLRFLLACANEDEGFFDKWIDIGMTEIDGRHRYTGRAHLIRMIEDEAIGSQLPAEIVARDAAVAQALGAAEVQWAYALTVHRAQGSGWDNIAILNDCPGEAIKGRWLYTALTRAAERATLLEPPASCAAPAQAPAI